MAILFLDFFGSDPSKMDQTCKFGEQTSRILEFKPEGLDFQLQIRDEWSTKLHVKPNKWSNDTILL